MNRVETLTIVFTDLVDSTAVSVALDQRLAAELRTTLFALQREEIERVGGTQVKNLGDGVMATFPNAASALAAAVAIQDRAARVDRRFPEPIRLRIGVSAGDVEVDEDDCFGEPVVEAARLCAAAPAGGVLAVQLVRLLAGRASGLSFGELQELELKGLPDPVPVCEVLWERRPDEEVPFVWPSGAERPDPLVGRAAERDAFGPVLSEVEAGASRLVVVTGESGVGKSRTAQELALAAHARGAVVVAGRAREELQVPFGPYLAALGHLVAHLDGAVLAEHVSVHGAALARVLPEVEQRMGPLPVLAETDPETERYRLYRAVAALLGEVGSVRPLVLVLDDLHAADTASLLLTRALLSEGVPGLLVLATYRPSELAADSPLHDIVSDQLVAGRLVSFDLAGLDVDEVAALIEARLGAPLRPEVRPLALAIAQETGGNPFYVSELVRHLVETGELGPDGATGAARRSGPVPLPASVRQVVQRRVQRLGGPAERALGAASILGYRFDVGLLVEVCGMDEDEVVDAVDLAVAAEVLRVVDDVPGECAFAHHIVRRTLHEHLSPPRRDLLHRRAAEALAARFEAGDGSTLSDIAMHAYEGRDQASGPDALAWCRRAAERAATQLAPDDAARWYGRALEIAGELRLGDDVTGPLLLGLGIAQRDEGAGTYRETLREAGIRAGRAGLAELQAQAGLANYRGFWSTSGNVEEDRIAELQAALDALGADDHVLAPRLLATKAVELGYADDSAVRAAMLDDALAMARRVDDLPTLAYTLRCSDMVHRLPWYLDKRQGHVEEHLALAAALGEPVEIFWSWFDGSLVALEACDAEAFAARVAQVQAAALATGQRLLEWIAGFVVGSAHIIRGEWDQAEVLMEHTHALGLAAAQPDAGAVYASHLFEIRRAQGRGDELVDLLAAVLAASPDIEAFRPALGVVYCDLDRTDGVELFQEDVDDGFARYRHNGLWLASTTLNAEIAAHLRHEAAAAQLYESLIPWRDQAVWTGTTPGRAVASTVGSLATVLGRFDEAEGLLRQGLAAHRAFEAPVWTADSLIALARLRLDRRADGDLGEAAALLTEAIEVAASVGAATHVRRAGRMLAEA